MEINLLTVLSYCLAFAFVIARLARLSLDFFYWLRKTGHYLLFTKPRLFSRRFRDNLPWNDLWVKVSGLLFGWFAVAGVKAWFVYEWLLLVLPALAMICIDLQLTKKDVSHLAVYALVVGVHTHRETGQDFFQRLTIVADGLPPGEIRSACRELIERRRSGLPVDHSCETLRGLHPILSEMVFTLRLTGWKASPAFDLATERLAQRAGKQWDQVSRWMVYREQIQPLVQFTQLAILAGLINSVVDGIPVFSLAWLSYEVLAWSGLGFLLAAGALFMAHQHASLRRMIGAVLVVVSLVPLGQSASGLRPFDLKLDLATLITGHVSDQQAVWETVRMPMTYPRLRATTQENEGGGSMPNPNQNATPALQGVVDTRTQPTALSSLGYAEVHLWTIPGCQPR